MDRPFKETGLRIENVRRYLGVSQSELAAILGVTQSSVSMCISGERLLRVEHALILLKTYGISLDFIYAGLVNSFPQNVAKALLSDHSER